MAFGGPAQLEQVVAGAAVEGNQDLPADGAAPVGAEGKPDQIAVQPDLAGLVVRQMLGCHQYRVARDDG